MYGQTGCGIVSVFANARINYCSWKLRNYFFSSSIVRLQKFLLVILWHRECSPSLIFCPHYSCIRIKEVAGFIEDFATTLNSAYSTKTVRSLYMPEMPFRKSISMLIAQMTNFTCLNSIKERKPSSPESMVEFV